VEYIPKGLKGDPFIHPDGKQQGEEEEEKEKEK